MEAKINLKQKLQNENEKLNKKSEQIEARNKLFRSFINENNKSRSNYFVSAYAYQLNELYKITDEIMDKIRVKALASIALLSTLGPLMDS